MNTNYQIEKDFIVLGKVIKERCKRNPKIKLISEDYDRGVFSLNYEQLEDDKWYQIRNDKGTLEITEIYMVTDNEEFDDWL